MSKTLTHDAIDNLSNAALWTKQGIPSVAWPQMKTVNCHSVYLGTLVEGPFMSGATVALVFQDSKVQSLLLIFGLISPKLCCVCCQHLKLSEWILHSAKCTWYNFLGHSWTMLNQGYITDSLHLCPLNCV